MLPKWGPHRDVVGELLAACRKVGLKAGVSSHRAFNWEFYTHDSSFDTNDPENFPLYGKIRSQRWPDQEFADDWYLRTKELVTKYQPDILWFDFYLDQPELYKVRYQLAADYYNLSQDWGKQVVLQYKYDTYHPGVGVMDIERGKLAGIQKAPWQTDTSVGYRGWCYVQDPEYKTPGLLVDDLIDIVSKNGNLLLNIGPKPDGTIPSQDIAILSEIGKWLKLNGEAIYATRPWVRFGEGPTQTTSGAHQERDNQGGTSKDYRFTSKGNALYAICLAWPDSDFSIVSLGLDSTKKFNIKIRNVELLGDKEPLKWKQTSTSLNIEKPNLEPCAYAYVFKIYAVGLTRQMSKFDKNLSPKPEIIYCFPGNSQRNGDEYTVRDGKLNQWKHDATIQWNIQVKETGTYDIFALQKNQNDEKYILMINNEEFTNPSQEPDNNFSDINIGQVEFSKTGNYGLTLRASPASEWYGKLTLKEIRLVKK